MIARLVACFLLAACGNLADVAHAQECDGPAQTLNYSEFFTKEYAGRIAWVAREGDETYYPLEDCTTLAFRRAERAYFVVNNVFEPRDGDGLASFVSIQVAKTQSQPQRERDVLIDRNSSWCREAKLDRACADRVPQRGFSSQPIAGLGPKQFFDLHATDSFDDSKLIVGSSYWHATPIGGVVSSASLRKRLIWDHSIFDEQPDRLLFLNRLYRFAFNDEKNTGVPFDVGIRGTQSIAIRVVSPLWSESSEYLIKVKRIR